MIPLAALQLSAMMNRRDCELIVIGRQGRHAVEELLGSTTRMVMSECSADVLVSTNRG
jgi:nucleotide-binding universal stress UspA family protein